MENHTPLPGLIERNKKSASIAASGSEGAKKGGGKFGGGKPASPNGDKNGPSRPFVPSWRCGLMVHGKPCNHLNYHYVSSEQSDTEVQKTCRKCGGVKKVADKKNSSEKSSSHNAESGMAAMQLKEIKELLLA